MNPQLRKRFGQHFLRDASIINRITNAIDPRPGEQLLEIGPGGGALTAALLQHTDSLHTIEIDRDLAASLQQRFSGKINLHVGDVLAFDFGRIANNQPWRIVGNLPYNISTPLIFYLLGSSLPITDMTFLLQWEVVERLAANPGRKSYGRLSVMTQYRCAVQPLFQVAPSAFKPPPKVQSALVRLTPHTAPTAIAKNEAWFARIVAQAFSQRRKTLGRALRNLIDPHAFSWVNIDPGRRAETLTVEEFTYLANYSIDNTL